MNFPSLTTLLHRYTPTPEEADYKKHMLTFIEQHKNCFKRSLETGHITASAFLLNQNENKALLMHHTKLDLWVQLGGHCDGNPNVLSVAIKEAQEESGITKIMPMSTEIFDIDIHRIPENKKEKAHDHYDVRFLLKAAGNEPLVQNGESKELRWISKNKEELPTRERSVVRLFEKWLSLQCTTYRDDA